MTNPAPRIIRAARAAATNPRDGKTQPEPPPEVTDRHVLCWTTDTTSVYAMSADDLLAEWIPGYASASYSTQKAMRLRHAVLTRTQLLTDLIHDADARSVPLSERERSVLLTPSSDQHILNQITWSAAVPLVLVHQPGPHPMTVPPGQILWLRPRAPEAYIRSLAEAGVITLAIGSPTAR